MSEAVLLKDSDVSAIVEEVFRRLQPHLTSTPPADAPRSDADGKDGVFATVDEAVAAAVAAQRDLARLGMEPRAAACDIIKRLCEENAEAWARLEYDETHIGRLDHKAEKLKLVKRVLGVEVFRTDARADSTGLGLIAAAPWGVVGLVTPATHSIPTMAGNAINLIAAGNAGIFSPHPSASKCFQHALQTFNHEIFKAIGVRNLLTTMANPTIQAAAEMFAHKDVLLICVTGGSAVVKAAMKHGKRVIAGGPGNPPVVVDETADLAKAARDVIAGCSFDNNLLCIGEKEVFVVEPAADAFLAELKRAGAVQLDAAQIERLTQAAFTFDEGKGAGCGRAHLKRDLIGKDASVLARAAGAEVPEGTGLLFGETEEGHPFVQEEQMMPFLPVVRVKDVEAAIEAAVRAEHGYKHTALVHSRNLETVTRMARRMNTTLFVQNATCAAALGLDGPGYLSYSIATPTGEGVTTPLTFTRQRQLVLGGRLGFA